MKCEFCHTELNPAQNKSYCPVCKKELSGNPGIPISGKVEEILKWILSHAPEEVLQDPVRLSGFFADYYHKNFEILRGVKCAGQKQTTKSLLSGDNHDKLFVCVEGLFLRSSPEIEEKNIIRSIPYGSELKVSETEGQWRKVKHRNTSGYVYGDFLITEKEKTILDAILKDHGTSETLKAAICRKALLNYYTEKNFIPRLSTDAQKKLFPAEQYGDSKIWNIPLPSAKYIVSGKIESKDSKINDLGIILEQPANRDRKFIFFTFNDNGSVKERSEKSIEEKEGISALVKNGNEVKIIFENV